MSYRQQDLRVQQSVSRRRQETPGLRPQSRHDQRFVPRRSKTDTAAREWVSADRPALGWSDGTQSCRGQSRSGLALHPPTCRARRSPSSPGLLASKRCRRRASRLSIASVQIVAGVSSRLEIAQTRRAGDHIGIGIDGTSRLFIRTLPQGTRSSRGGKTCESHSS
jgi:hypothetical protein